MKIYLSILNSAFLSLILFSSNGYAHASETPQPNQNLNTKIQNVVERNRIKFDLSALAVSVKLPGKQSIHDYVSGSTMRQGGLKISESNLFQIGSITKSFIAAIILQLESEGKIDINSSMGVWFSQYPNWQSVTVKQLLNQTSGIYNYSDTPGFFSNLIKHPSRILKCEELVKLAYQHQPNSYFPIGEGWHYSNTNYILAGMIIEKITGHSLNEEINRRLLLKKLHNTFYLPYPKIVLGRLVHGYNDAQSISPQRANLPLHTDITGIGMSWAGAAGALISNSHDIALWTKSLFDGTTLQPKQLAEMLTLVSMKTGQPVERSRGTGYGLGVGSNIGELPFNKKYGKVYDHSGGTLGYSAYFIYLPCYDLIITFTANATVKSTDKLEQIINDVIAVVLKSDEWQEYKKKHRFPSYCLHSLGR
ncbi:MAG: beta-lactamase family protein [Gammaproteobacteria bacterium]|nr:beta-lactamase family protein [Gammaproteobacteria bacterium]